MILGWIRLDFGRSQSQQKASRKPAEISGKAKPEPRSPEPAGLPTSGGGRGRARRERSPLGAARREGDAASAVEDTGGERSTRIPLGIPRDLRLPRLSTLSISHEAFYEDSTRKLGSREVLGGPRRS